MNANRKSDLERLKLWENSVLSLFEGPMFKISLKHVHVYLCLKFQICLQGGWGGWPTGNGKKLSSCQAQLGQATCLAVA